MPMRNGKRALRRLLGAAPRALLGTITHVVTQEPVAALTFDDGPHPKYTPRLLEILEKHGARATFFMVGKSAQENRELVRQMALAGHAIGNHSWDHPSFPLITGRERREQLRACEQAIAPYGQRLFRPPYGEQSLASRWDARCLGYQAVTWNLEVGDWWNDNAHHMADLLVRRIKPGSVVVLHDALCRHPNPVQEPKLPRQPYVDRGPMLEAVSMLLEQLGHRYRFLTIPELLQCGRAQRANWYKVRLPNSCGGLDPGRGSGEGHTPDGGKDVKKGD